MSRAFTKEREDAPDLVLPARRRPDPASLAPAAPGIVGYGARVGIAAEDGTVEYFTLVDEDSVDVPSGRIGIESPLARALLGARVGDVVVWHRPAGDRSVRVESIAYD